MVGSAFAEILFLVFGDVSCSTSCLKSKETILNEFADKNSSNLGSEQFWHFMYLLCRQVTIHWIPNELTG
uniref:Secreted protein n=1 Tax=Rhizophora mucronata TaxID=61149 RepID=A0A2P2M230_RHIMU